MKKKLLVCVMAAAALFAVTGCTNNNNPETTTTAQADKKLACNASLDGETLRITLTYDGDSIKKAVYSMSEKQKDEKAAKKEYENRGEDVKKFNAYKGLSVNSSYSGTLVSASFSFTVADMDDDAKGLYNEFLGEIKDKNLNDAKSALIDAGYSCTES